MSKMCKYCYMYECIYCTYTSNVNICMYIQVLFQVLRRKAEQ